MKATTLLRKFTRKSGGLLVYGSALLLAPILGVMVAVVAAWQALLAGSIWYLPLGLVLLLAAIAMLHSHRLFDVALLGLVMVAGAAWSRADAVQQSLLLEPVQALVPQTGVLVALLVLMLLALVLIHSARHSGRW